MSRVQGTHPYLRAVPDAVSPGDVGGLPVMPLRADWARMLRDITCCGILDVEVANPVARLKCRAEPWYAAVQGTAALVKGPGIALAALTEYWALADIALDGGSRHYEHLDVSDHQGQRLLRLSLSAESDWSGFHATLVRQWACRGVPVPVPEAGAREKQLMTLQCHGAMQACGRLQDNWYDFQRRRFAGRLVDPSLLAPFLETFTDQLCAVTAVVGNSGLLQMHECVFHDCRIADSQLRLRGAGAQLDIDLLGVATARVVDDSGESQVVRLYDQDARCVAAIGMPRGLDRADRELWRSMLRALRD